MDSENKDKLISDLQRMSEIVHENTDAVKWAIGMMRQVMQEHDSFVQLQYVNRNSS